MQRKYYNYLEKSSANYANGKATDANRARITIDGVGCRSTKCCKLRGEMTEIADTKKETNSHLGYTGLFGGDICFFGGFFRA